MMKRFLQPLIVIGMLGFGALFCGDAQGASSNTSKRPAAAQPAAMKAHPRHAAKATGKSKLLAKKAPRQSWRNRQIAPTPDRIRAIQAGLARSGFYQGEPSGTWDSATVDAMKRFQEAQGLNATGKIDALSLQKLGLGSDVAGLGAPRTPLPATALPQTSPQNPNL